MQTKQGPAEDIVSAQKSATETTCLLKHSPLIGNQNPVTSEGRTVLLNEASSGVFHHKVPALLSQTVLYEAATPLVVYEVLLHYWSVPLFIWLYVVYCSLENVFSSLVLTSIINTESAFVH